MKTTLIALPYTTPPLTANQRLHWATRAKTTKQIRTTTKLLARKANLTPTTHAEITLHYTPKDNRRRDEDNLVPTLKACCDGLVDAGLVPDDTPNYMTKNMPRIHHPGPPTSHGRIYLEINHQ